MLNHIRDAYRQNGAFGLLIDQTRNGKSIDGEQRDRILYGLDGAYTYEATMALRTALDMLVPIEDGDSIGKDRLHALADRSSMTQIALDQVDKLREGDFVANASTDDIFTTFIAILASGNTTALEGFGKATAHIRDRILQDNPAFERIYELINKQPQKLHLISKYFNDDTLISYRRYVMANATSRICDVQADARDNRRSLLDYAQDVAFNTPLVTSLDEQFANGNREAILENAEKLDWEVMPYGAEGVKRFTEDLIASIEAKEGIKPTIDLRRLDILENLREWWEAKHGAKSTDYKRGVFKKRRTVTDENGKKRPDDYLVLVLKDTDENGQAIEHAVAESPIAGPHALYIQRFDVNGWDWEELMGNLKDEVREMGARKLLHTPPTNGDLVESLTEKAKLLLDCDPNDFLDLQFAGYNKEGLPRTYRAMGKRALDSSTFAKVS